MEGIARGAWKVDPTPSPFFFFFFFITLGLELSDPTVYEPGIRALFGTASHFCEAVVPKLGIVQNGAWKVDLTPSPLHP